MDNLIKFGRKTSWTTFDQTLPIMTFAEDHTLRRVTAADLARKHGLTIDRAEMLVDRFGANHHALEGAALALVTRMN